MPFTNDDPPRIWDFAGPCGKDTHYKLQVFGRPDARALRHLIKQLELTAEFVEEDAKAEPHPAPAEGAE